MDSSYVPNADLSTTDVFRVIDEIEQLGVFRIGFSGGEPFFREDFLDILDKCSQKNIRIGITTNGSLINDVVVKRLAALKTLELVQISLDGPNAQTHNYIRGNDNSFKEALNAIELLKKVGIKVGVVTTLMKTNVDLVPKIVDLIEELGVSVYGARRFIPVGKGSSRTKELLISIDEYKKHLYYWNNLYLNNKSLQFTIEEPLLALIDNQSHICQGGNSYGAITADGDVRSCIFLPVSFGNVKEKTLKECWDYFKTTNAMDTSLGNSKCSICTLVNICGGCRAMAYAEYGDVKGYDSLCFINDINTAP